jgi:hypothetical protein
MSRQDDNTVRVEQRDGWDPRSGYWACETRIVKRLRRKPDLDTFKAIAFLLRLKGEKRYADISEFLG